jgi:hypothetical protein
MVRSIVPWLTLATTACGTMFSGVEQDVLVSSSPPDAQITLYELDGTPVIGPAPTNQGPLRTHRPKDALPYLSIVSREGYCPAYQLTKVSPTGGYVAESLLTAIPVIGQLIGLAGIMYDNSTGGCCTIEPLEIVLEPEQECR